MKIIGVTVVLSSLFAVLHSAPVDTSNCDNLRLVKRQAAIVGVLAPAVASAALPYLGKGLKFMASKMLKKSSKKAATGVMSKTLGKGE